MSTTDKKIIWEKWHDPYGETLEESEWPGAFGTFETDDMVDKMKRRSSGEKGEEWDEDSYKEIVPTTEAIARLQTKPMKLLATPLGLIPMTEWSTPSKVFNFWMGHTNFRITKNIQDIIDGTDGVETFDVFSSYRFRIAIGKAFDSIEVKKELMNKLNAVSGK